MSNNLNKLRTVINKYTDKPSDIVEGVCSLGEIVISTQKNNEGIYIKNNANEDSNIIFTLNLRVKNADNGIITPNTSKNEE